jgi:glutathione peroxidase
MKKNTFAFLLFIAMTITFLACMGKRDVRTRPSTANVNNSKSMFYDFKLKALDGNSMVDFSQYKGKKVIVLNVASKCGYTPQYADWQKFYDENKGKVEVVGFPSNEFLGQEPGSNNDIAEFCQKNYGVTFQMFEKTNVKGSDKSPLFDWLTNKEKNGWNDKEPTWNFCKYLINENGELVNFFSSTVTPDDAEFKKAIGL